MYKSSLLHFNDLISTLHQIKHCLKNKWQIHHYLSNEYAKVRCMDIKLYFAFHFMNYYTNCIVIVITIDTVKTCHLPECIWPQLTLDVRGEYNCFQLPIPIG